MTLVAYTGDGRLLASAGADRAVRLWHARPGDLTAGKLAQTLDGHDAPAMAMAAQGQPALLVVLARDGNVHRWEPATGKLVDQRSLGSKLLAAAIRPGPAPQAAVVSTDGLALVDHQSGQTIAVATHPMGETLATREPQTVLAGKFSMLHAVAATAVYGSAGASAFARNSLSDPRVSALRSRVRLLPHDDIKPWPKDRPARVEITFINGWCISASIDSARGGPDDPFDEAELQAKIAALTADLRVADGGSAGRTGSLTLPLG